MKETNLSQGYIILTLLTIINKLALIIYLELIFLSRLYFI